MTYRPVFSEIGDSQLGFQTPLPKVSLRQLEFCSIFANPLFWRFLALKSSPDRIFDFGHFMRLSSRYSPGIQLVRLVIPLRRFTLCTVKPLPPPLSWVSQYLPSYDKSMVGPGTGGSGPGAGFGSSLFSTAVFSLQ